MYGIGRHRNSISTGLTSDGDPEHSPRQTLPGVFSFSLYFSSFADYTYYEKGKSEAAHKEKKKKKTYRKKSEIWGIKRDRTETKSKEKKKLKAV